MWASPLAVGNVFPDLYTLTANGLLSYFLMIFFTTENDPFPNVSLTKNSFLRDKHGGSSSSFSILFFFLFGRFSLSLPKNSFKLIFFLK